MMDHAFLNSFFHVSLSYMDIAVLVFASFLGSLVTASLGVGGGAFLIIVMAEFLAPVVLIPVHGLVQMASNAGRAWLTRSSVDWDLVKAFLLGGVLASLLGSFGLHLVPETVIQWCIAVFILYSCWGKVPEVGLSASFSGRVGGGFVTTLATLFAGATGPLVASWLRTKSMDRFYYTANFSTCMTLQHMLKIMVFSFAGFSFAQWFGLLFLMVISGFIGTKVGLKVLGKLPEKQMKLLFKCILTLLAGRLIYRLLVA
ncbi:sulfite exporter TauE/SafE family protein [Litoribrevibacter albus]|nr:sulfite exporter TauE/SafE family protein [Litoribrevibacter albus]